MQPGNACVHLEPVGQGISGLDWECAATASAQKSPLRVHTSQHARRCRIAELPQTLLAFLTSGILLCYADGHHMEIVNVDLGLIPRLHMAHMLLSCMKGEA